MSQPFLSEIKIMSFNYAPKGWAQCNGQLLPINQNQALFSLLGTTYGGNGQTTFALPNLQGKVPMHFGNGHTLGEKGGTTSVTLSQQQMPTHGHLAQASTSVGDTPNANNTILAAAQNLYAAASNLTPILPETVTNVGGSQPHENRQPYLVLCFCIALQGIFPSRN
ncbi:MAG TPA: tail fiber protein [Pyrinomonadaceae bacterium]|nr:tail fiber protein [Pyrinomonadaceae bacterium]